ncbi:MAG: sugar transferase [Chloroflexi bacterium]|nr:sugar transferase [Chloroflexota bacterium]
MQQRISLITRFGVDLILISVAFVLAYLIRYVLQWGADVLEQNQVPLGDYLPIMLGYSAIFFVVLQFKGFYRNSRGTTLLDELGIVFSTSLVTVSTMIVLVFISQPLTRSRLMFVYLVPLTVLLLTSERAIIRWIRRILWTRGIGTRNLVIVGATDAATRLMQTIVENPNLGYRLVGYVDDELRFSEWIMPVRYRNGDTVPHLGSSSALPELIAKHHLNEVIIALPAIMHETINEVMGQARQHKLEYTFVPDLFELRLDALTLQEINGIPLIGLKDNSLVGWNYIVKRLVDVLLALLLLSIFAVPMLIIALIVKLSSPGSIIVRQIRIGKEGRPFTFYKFRSMYRDAEARLAELEQHNETSGPTFKMKNDPRVTNIGRFMRHASIDELPQLFNILLGHMSFVGPRPGLPREVDKYEAWHFRRLEVTPGLSGLWQVSGRSTLPFEEMVKLDIYYAEHWSLWLDLKIIVRTLPAVIRGDGAY